MALLVFAVLFYENAYVCDDAFISFRTIDNFVRGLGLRWNVAERVQVFTSPLFTLLLAGPYWLFHDPRPEPNPHRIYVLVLLVSFVLSSTTVWLLARRLRKCSWFWVCFALLASSQAFVTFTSSGLETPLTYLLVAAFYTEFLSRREEAGLGEFARLFLIAGLAVLNRLDTALLFAPACGYLLFVGARRYHWRVLLPAMLSLHPILLWTAFSIVYYGFPFPNSYYAKLGQGASRPLLLGMGFGYLADCCRQDPITVAGIACGIAGVLTAARKGWRRPLAALGAAAYAAYAVAIGGDFIGFRFLAPPLLIAALLLYDVGAGCSTGNSRTWATSAVLLLIVYSLFMPSSPLRCGWDGPRAEDVAFYYRASALSRWRPGLRFAFSRFLHVADPQDCIALRSLRARVAVWGDGLNGFCRGPDTYLVDPHGITDPLLARLVTPIDRPFEPGHLFKPLPAGYIAHLLDPAVPIADPGVAALYEKLKTVTRGPLFSLERWKNIVRLNVLGEGRYTRPYESQAIRPWMRRDAGRPPR